MHFNFLLVPKSINWYFQQLKENNAVNSGCYTLPATPKGSAHTCLRTITITTSSCLSSKYIREVSCVFVGYRNDVDSVKIVLSNLENFFRIVLNQSDLFGLGQEAATRNRIKETMQQRDKEKGRYRVLELRRQCDNATRRRVWIVIK